MERARDTDLFRVIHQRKSVRHFTGHAVSDSDIEKMLRAAMAAPSAVNCQPWEFVVVRERSLLDTLCDGLPYAKMLAQAGAAIVVCGRPDRAHNRMKEYAILDPALAAQNILLAAEGLGLGAVWTAAYPYAERMSFVRSTLAIPEFVIPVCVIPVGHPTGEDVVKEKYDPTKIHNERWT